MYTHQNGWFCDWICVVIKTKEKTPKFIYFFVSNISTQLKTRQPDSKWCWLSSQTNICTVYTLVFHKYHFNAIHFPHLKYKLGFCDLFSFNGVFHVFKLKNINWKQFKISWISIIIWLNLFEFVYRSFWKFRSIWIMQRLKMFFIIYHFKPISIELFRIMHESKIISNNALMLWQTI